MPFKKKPQDDGPPQSLNDLIRLAGDAAIKRLAESYAARGDAEADSDPNRRETEADGYRAEALRRKKIQTQARASKQATSIMLFDVDEYGSLSASDFDAPETREEVYDEIPTDWHRSADRLLAARELCRPLEYYLHALYLDARYLIEEKLANVKTARSKEARSLKAVLDDMPEDAEAGAAPWIGSMSPDEFDSTVVQRVKMWLSEEPDWSKESDYISHEKTAEGLAFLYLRDDVSLEAIDLLDISLIEGDRPGSNLCYAVLKISVSGANSRAEAEGLPVRFRSRPD